MRLLEKVLSVMLLVGLFNHRLLLAQMTDSNFSIPMLFPYTNCSSVPSPLAYYLYFTHTSDTKEILFGFPVLKSGRKDWSYPDGDKTWQNSHIQPVIKEHPKEYEYYNEQSYYCENVISLFNSVKFGPTVSLSASIRGSNFAHVFSTLPLALMDSPSTGEDIRAYEYYIIFGSYNPLNSINAVGVVVGGTGDDKVGVRIKSNAEMVAIKNATYLANFMEMVKGEINLNTHEVLWIEPATTDCTRIQNLTATTVMSTEPLAVFTARGRCGGSGSFSYDLNLLHQIPPLHKWGKIFVMDVLHLEILPSTNKDNTISFTMVSIQDKTDVLFEWYGLELHNKSMLYKLKSKQPITVTKSDYSQFSHIQILATEPILILYEAYSPSEETVYFSVILQPVEWFSNQQSVVLSKPLGLPLTSEWQYHVTIAVPKEYFNTSSIMINNTRSKTQSTVPLEQSQYYHGSMYMAGTYVLIPLELNSSLQLEDSALFLFISHTNSCAKLGATVYAYGLNATGYAYANGFIVDSSPPDGRKCSVLAKKEAAMKKGANVYNVVVGVISAILIFAITVTVVIAVIMYTRKTKYWDKEPNYDQYEFDAFLSFADEDKDFAANFLYQPLTSKGYHLFWHYEHFIPGKCINDNIIRATVISRRIIFVCSSHFHKSKFCQMELKRGLEEYSKTRTRRIIPIVLQEEYCPEELQFFNQLRLNHTDLTRGETEQLMHRIQLGKSIQEYKKIN